MTGVGGLFIRSPAGQAMQARAGQMLKSAAGKMGIDETMLKRMGTAFQDGMADYSHFGEQLERFNISAPHKQPLELYLDKKVKPQLQEKIDTGAKSVMSNPYGFPSVLKSPHPQLQSWSWTQMFFPGSSPVPGTFPPRK